MIKEKKDVMKMTDSELLPHIKKELYVKLNENLGFMNKIKLSPDESSERVISDYYLNKYNNPNQMDELITNAQLKGKGFFKFEISKSIPLKRIQTALDNNIIFNNFLSLIDENLQKNDSIFLQQHCFTHVGININFDAQSLHYSIYFILSQKYFYFYNRSLNIEQFYSVNDGVVFLGTMLELNSYLYCIKVMKNQKQFFVITPENIFFCKQSAKFAIFINFENFGKNVPLRLIGLRRIIFYCLNNCNNPSIPYLQPNFNENSIPWNNLDESYVEQFDFKNFQVKNETLEMIKVNFLNPSNNNINQNATSHLKPLVKNDSENSFNRFNQPTSLNNQIKKNENILEFEFKETSNVKAPSRFMNKLNTSGTFFQSNFLRNKNGNQNSNIITQTIPEENSIIASSNQKINNLPINNSLPVNTLNNNLFSEESLRNNIGSKLQNAEIQRNNLSMNRNTYTTNGNNFPLSNNVQSHNFSFNNSNGNNLFQSNNINNQNNNNNIINQQENFISSTKNFSPIQKQTNFNNENIIMQSGNPPRYNTFTSNMNIPVTNNNNFNNQLPNTSSLINNTNSGYIFNHNTTNNNPNPSFNSVANFQTPYGMISWGGNSLISNNPFSNDQQHINKLPQFKPIIALHKSSKYTIFTVPNTNPNKWKENLGCFSSNSIEPSNSLKNIQSHFILSNNFKQSDPRNSQNNFIKNYNLTCFSIQNILLSVPYKRDFCDYLQAVTKSNTNNPININLPRFQEQIFKTVEKGPNKTNINPYVSGSAIKFKENRKFEIPQNYYNSIDYYIFRDALNVGKAESDNKIKNETERNDKILETISNKYLTDQDINSSNKAFEELYNSRNCYDIIVLVRNEEIPAHKIVLLSKSSVFKEMIQNNEQNLGKFSSEMFKIIMPESYKINIFKEIIKWIYTGKISDSFDISSYREMLLIADSLKIFPLQKIIIVKYIIPKMTKETSIQFVKDSFKKSVTSENKEVWNLLSNFSLNCIAKHSSILIKNKRNEFLGMDIELLTKCVEQSVFFLVEESHLGNLIRLIIDGGFATDIFDLLCKISKPYLNAQNYHTQSVDLSDIFKQIDVRKPIEIKLINDETVDDEERNENVKEKKNLFENFFEKDNNEEKKNSSKEGKNLCKNTVEIEVKNTQNHPSSNFVQTVNLKNNKKPTFSFNFQINYEELNSCTIFSEVFNTANRSWCLKLDITNSGDVSFYLVERGSPILEKPHAFYSIYQDKFSLKFYSILFEFEIKDISFEKSAIIFHSFASQQHQIVGYNNFFNIKQLGKKDICCFNVWIKEFTLHSACLQHICDNFQTLIQTRKKVEKENSINNLSTNANSSSNLIKIDSPSAVKKGFYDMNPHDLAYISYSDNLRVDNENILFTTIYRFSIDKNPSDIENLMNTIRYNYVDLKLLCTAARDHEAMRHSYNFKRKFTKELYRRFKDNLDFFSPKKESLEKPTSALVDILSSEKKDEKNSENKQNKLKLVEGKERNFYSVKENKKPFNIINELSNWFLDSEHHSGYIKEVETYKKMLEEEKLNFEKREAALLIQKREIQADLQRVNERELKRRKMQAIQQNNPNNNNNTYASKITQCKIF